jgi:FixJ family two-component response regulator
MEAGKMTKLAFIVVDEIEERKRYGATLERCGFNVEAFPDEEQALAALEKKSPHIAIVHFGENMTRTVALIDKLYRHDPTICILYFTFYGGEKLHDKAAAAGAYAVLEKPFSLYDEKFIEFIAMAFRESQRRKSLAAGKDQALVLMPFKKEFDEIYLSAIKEPLTALGYQCERADELLFVGDVVQQLYDKLEQSELIIADMSGQNPNVFYEIGYADALRKTVILLVQNENDVPFDVRGRRFIIYEGNALLLREKLIETVKNLEIASDAD